ncbi:MAG: hypothetical protein CM15mP18_3270 [Methanobacteriota archaeon]|nr:MAG: hypothetical protein CM15mP18_3270 [Euryarchaeota archaeon]
MRLDGPGVVATDVVGQRFEVGIAHGRPAPQVSWRVEQLGPGNHVTRRGHQPLLVAVGEGREAGAKAPVLSAERARSHDGPRGT